MNKTLNYLPILIALFPQFLFEDYELIMITTILIGIIAYFSLGNQNVFFRIFLSQLFVFSIAFLIYENRIFYLYEVFRNFELPELLLVMLFILFNTLNISLLFIFGYKIGSVILNKN